MLKKRMLLLSTTFPFPPIGGEKIWDFNIIKHLSATWQIDLCTFIGNKQEKEMIKNYNFNSLSIYTVTLPKINSYCSCLKGLFDTQPLQIHYYSSKAMQRLINQRLNFVKYDLILCHFVRMAQYVKDYQKVKKVLYMADALSLRYALSSRLHKNYFRFVEWLESKRLREYEPKISAQFDLNLVSSSIDKIYLEKLGVKRLEVLENGIDLEDIEFKNVGINLNKIVFFGNLRTFHNIDTVIYFYKKIFSLVKKEIKEIEFVVVGANIPKCILELRKDKSVEIFADVPDIKPYISDATVSVAPMRIAVGIQNKILQAMALKIPVVTTKRGLGGIQAQPDKDILVADSPQDFADKVIRLIQDESLRTKIRENAYRLVKEKYLWSDIAENLNHRLISLLEK